MMTTIRIAFRNTRRQKKRSFLLGGAIAFGVMMITLLNAFTAGLIDNVKLNFSYIIGGHIFITGSEMTGSGRVISSIGDDDIAQTALDEILPYVQQINRRSQSMGLLIFGAKDSVQRLDGINWEAEPDLIKNLTVMEGSLDDVTDRQAMVLPQATASKLGVAVGETVLVKLSTVTGQQNLGEFRIIAITQDQSGFGIDSAYVGLQYLNELLDLEEDAYQMLHVFLHDMADMDMAADIVHESISSKAEVEPRYSMGLNMDRDEDMEEAQMEAINQLFGGERQVVEPWVGTKFAVTTLNDVMAPVMSLIGVLNTIGLVVFIILLVITMVGIMNTFRMVLIERTQEIGTMRAIGMQQSAVRNIFMLEALFIGLGGACAGFVMANAVMLVLSLISFNTDSALKFFLYQNRLTFRLVPGSVAVNLTLLMAMTVLAAYVPARAAARLRPADALRATY